MPEDIRRPNAPFTALTLTAEDEVALLVSRLVLHRHWFSCRYFTVARHWQVLVLSDLDLTGHDKNLLRGLNHTRRTISL